jgi:hypothetical protein
VAAPFGLSFEVAARHRPFELVAPGFEGTTDAAVGACDGLRRSGYSPPAPFVGVEVEVRDTGGATVLVGLSADAGDDTDADTDTDAGDHLLGFYDPVRRRAGLELRRDGHTTVLAERPVDPRKALRLAFVLCENRATLLALTDRGEGPFRGWRPIVSERRKVSELVDLRDPATLARFTASWGARGGTADLGAARAGLFGMAGLRDLHVVQHADGRPYLRDGRMFLTATCAGLGFFQQAHWGVFSVDPADLAIPASGSSAQNLAGALTQTAQLFTRRHGLLLGDHAGQLVRDGDTWLLATSSWGDFSPQRGVHVRHLATRDDLLTGVHLLETERTALPTAVSAWDPGMTRIDGRWHVSYVESPSQDPFEFHPALAATDAATWTDGLAAVGAATDLAKCEGPVLAEVDGRWWLLASDGDRREYPVFDLAMNRVGELDAPYGSNIPHPQVLTLPGGQQVLVTFDGTHYAKPVLGYGTHGDVVVMRHGPPPGPVARRLRSGRGARLVGAVRRLRDRAT